MELAARILGGGLILAWLILIPVTRRAVSRVEEVAAAVIFRRNVLPFVAGVGLVLTGTLWFLLVAALAWAFAGRFPYFFSFVFPHIMGWQYGTAVCRRMAYEPTMGGGFIGLFAVALVSALATTIVTSATGKLVEAEPEEDAGTTSESTVFAAGAPKP